MIISDDHRLAFVHIPKCAGVSVRRPLKAIDSRNGFYSKIGDHPDMGRIHFAHIVLRDLAAHFPEDYARLQSYHAFAVVRDPHARFLSAIFQRLREFKDVPQSAITSERVEQEAGEVIKALEASPDRLDLELVHFNRQVDYLEHDGVRIVDAVFGIEQMPALAVFLSSRTGIEISEGHENRSVELRFAGLPFVRSLRRPYAALVPQALRVQLRERLMGMGLYGAANKSARLPAGSKADGFIRAYYARDFEIHGATR